MSTRRPEMRRRRRRGFFRSSYDGVPHAGFAGTSLQKLFKGRKVVLFALPGAFTGVCEKGHVPSFAKLVNEFQQKGVDEVACVAINDPYCLHGWAKAMQTTGISRSMSAIGPCFISAAGYLGGGWSVKIKALEDAKIMKI